MEKKLSRAQKIDRYGELDRQIHQFKPVQEEHKQLKDEIQSWYADKPGEPQTAKGNAYTLQLTPAENVRTVTDKPKAFKLLQKAVGLAKLIELLTIPLGAAIDKFIDKSEHPQFLTEERTGSRKITAVLNKPADAKAVA